MNNQINNKIISIALLVSLIVSTIPFDLSELLQGNIFKREAKADITTGLTGHWKFDEGSGTITADSSSNGNNGTLKNNPTWTTGKINGAISFDGTDDFIDIPDVPNGTLYDFNIGNSFTLSAWIKPTTTTVGQAFISKRGALGLNYAFEIALWGSGGQLALNKEGGSAQGDVISATGVSAGVWNHVVAVKNGTTVTFYINGTSSPGDAAWDNFGPTADPLSIGGPSSFLYSSYFNGAIDDVRIYNRALTSTDVTELFNFTGGAAPTPAPAPTSDTTPPTVSITSPISGSTVSGTITVSADASDNIGIAGVTFKVDGTTIGSEDTTSPYSISWNTAAVINGSHTLTAVARDSAGNTTTSSGLTVNVSNVSSVVDITSGLIGHWKFDEGTGTTAADSSGSGNSGTLTSGPTWTTAGKIGGALQFDGVNDYVNIFDATDPTAYTISAWVKPNSVLAQSIFVRTDAGGPTFSWSHQLRITSDNAIAKFGHYTYGPGTITGSTTISTGTWYHIVALAQNNGPMRLYVNGVEEGTAITNIGTLWTGGNQYHIGSNSGFGMGYFNGVIDDVRIYNRVLTSTDIQELFNSATEITPPTVSITSPISGSTVSGTITVSADASDNIGIAGVTFKVDGTTIGSEDTTSPYSISWNTAAVINGSHTLTAVARDSAGNTTTSSAVTITTSNAPDTISPIVSITSPSGGSTIFGTITVSADASDNVSVAGVQFLLDGVNLGSEDTVSPYFVSWDITTVATGSHTLTAKARDGVGNITTSSAVTVTVSRPKTVLTQNDLIYLGAFDLPNCIIRGLSIRYISGSRYFLQLCHPYELWRVPEPSLSFSAPYPKAVIDKNYGDLAGGKTPSDLLPMSTGTCAFIGNRGVFWDDVLSRVYVTYGCDYGNVAAEYTLFAASLDDTTPKSTFLGCWGFGGNASFFSGILPIPEWFTSQYLTPGYRLGVGFGGDVSSLVDVSMGPALSAFSPPTNTTNGCSKTPTWLLNTRLIRFPLNLVPYTIPEHARLLTTNYWHWDPTYGWNPKDGRGFWHKLMYAASQNLVWVDTPNKSGLFQMENMDWGKFEATVLASPAPTATSATLSTVMYTDGTSLQANDLIEIQYDPVFIENCNESKLVKILSVSGNTITFEVLTTISTTNSVPLVGGRVIGGAFYCHAVLNSTREVLRTFIYNPADLAAVAQGTKEQWQPDPTSAWNMTFDGVNRPDGTIPGTGGGARNYAPWLTFDPLSKRLYIAIDAVTGGNFPAARVYVYSINDGTAPVTDTTSPTVSITSPLNGTTVSGTTSIAANASDNVGVTGVQFLLDGVNLGTEDTSSPYSISWDTTTTTNGSHTLTARARDATGNTTTSSPITVTVSNAVDTTLPTVSITSPTSGSTVSSTVSVSANASDNIGVTGVQFKLDGANLGTEDTTSPYSITWNTTSATNGSHTLTAIARDAAGNATTSSAVSVTVNNDATPPTISNIQATNVTTSGATITWTTNEASTSQVEYGLTTSYGNLIPEDSTLVTNHSVNLTNLSQNTTYNYRVISKDSSGNKAFSINSTLKTLGIGSDTTLPSSVSDLSVKTTAINSVTLTWTATGDDGNVGQAFKYDLRYSRIPITKDNFLDLTSIEALGVSAPKISGFQEEFTIIGLKEDTLYYFAIKVIDESANASLISNIPSARTNPLVVITSIGGISPGGGGGGGGDTVPPSSVSSVKAQAADSQILISWKNPLDPDFAKNVLIRRKETPFDKLSFSRCSVFFDKTCGGGDLAFIGKAEEFIDLKLENGKVYHYAIFAFDEAANQSEPRFVSAIPEQGKVSFTEPSQITTLPFKEGTVIKFEGDPDTFYLVEQNQLRLIKSQDILISYGFSPSEVILLEKEKHSIDDFKVNLGEPLEKKILPFIFTRVLSFRLRGDDVSKLQELLSQDPDLYPEKLITGFFGSLTRRAVQRFQEKYGFSSSGQANYGSFDEETRRKFIEVFKLTPPSAVQLTTNLFLGSKGDEVKFLQEFLINQDLYPEKRITSFFGPLTQRAVINFQKKYKITPSRGFVGPLTRAKIQKLLEEEKQPKPKYQDGLLIKSQIKPEIYIIKNSQKQLIPNLKILYSHGFFTENITILPEEELNSIPTLPTPLEYNVFKDGTLIQATNNPIIYIIRNAKLFIIPPSVFTQRGFTQDQIIKVHPDVIKEYEFGGVVR